jgi:hypothetical protein
MTFKVTKDWRVNKEEGSLEIRIYATIGTKNYAAEGRIWRELQHTAVFVERDLRRRLMAEIEADLFADYDGVQQ